jgi:hypothetical protein
VISNILLDLAGRIFGFISTRIENINKPIFYGKSLLPYLKFSIG